MPAHPHNFAGESSSKTNGASPQIPSFTAADAVAVRNLGNSSSRLGGRVKEALGVLDEAIARYGRHLHLSFNGGKDCTVLIHLLAACLLPSQSQSTSFHDANDVSSSLPPAPNSNGTAGAAASTSKQPHLANGQPTPPPYRSDTAEQSKSIPSIYIQCQSPFPQVEEFVDRCSHIYNLRLTRINAPMKAALERYKAEQEEQEVRAGRDKGNAVQAILVGTRAGDPYSDTLDYFTPTDGDWPELMRVHPVLHWTYDDVWEFLRSPHLSLDGKMGGVEWCNLYDYGYTSLGSTFNTEPNPELKDDSRASGWKPAWELKNAASERAGRPKAGTQM